MTLLRVDASIQGDRSASSALADLIIGQITAAQPQIAVVCRHLGEDPLPATAWAAAGVGSHTPEADRTPAHREALELASRVATELQEATGAVLALPLYNYGVSQHAKTWIDLAMAGAPFGTPLLDGKPSSWSPPAAAPTAPVARGRAGTTTSTTCAASWWTPGTPTSPWSSASSPSWA